jgi:hypothetical protein
LQIIKLLFQVLLDMNICIQGWSWEIKFSVNNRIVYVCENVAWHWLYDVALKIVNESKIQHWNCLYILCSAWTEALKGARWFLRNYMKLKLAVKWSVKLFSFKILREEDFIGLCIHFFRITYIRLKFLLWFHINV